MIYSSAYRVSSPETAWTVAMGNLINMTREGTKKEQKTKEMK